MENTIIFVERKTVAGCKNEDQLVTCDFLN